MKLSPVPGIVQGLHLPYLRGPHGTSGGRHYKRTHFADEKTRA